MINKAHIKIGDVIYGSSDSVDIIYDNTESGLESNNIQDAIDEIAAGACFADGIVVNVEMANWIAQEDGTYTNTVAIEGILESEMYDVSLYGDSTEEQAHAFDFLVTDIDTYDGQIVLTASEEITVAFSVILRGKINLENKNVYVSDLSATNIEYDNSESNMVATDIQNAIDELATSVKGIVVSVTTDSWDLQEDGTYKKIIPVEQITGKETLDVCLYPGDIHTEEQVVAFSELITSIETGEGRITLTSTEAITVQFRIFLYGKINFENSSVVFKDCSAADIAFDDTVAKLGAKNIQEADVALALRPVNNNLLINSNFANPVNQRGVTAETWANATYGIDRWRMGGGVLEFLDNGISIKSTRLNETVHVFFEQRIEKLPIDKTYTVSAKIDGKIYSATHKFLPMSSSNVVVIIDEYGNILNNLTEDVGDLILFIFKTFASGIVSISVGSTYTTAKIVEWVKLEEGEVATPYVPRLYQEEYLLCQRYYQIVDTGESSCLGTNTNDIKFNIRPPFKMRAKGTLIDNGLEVRKDANTQSGFTFTFTKWDASIAFVSITASKSSHGVTYANYPTLGGTISIDAEL